MLLNFRHGSIFNHKENIADLCSNLRQIVLLSHKELGYFFFQNVFF